MTFDMEQPRTRVIGAPSLESFMFPPLHVHHPSAGQDPEAFDWLTHGIICGSHIDALAVAAQDFSAFRMQPMLIEDVQEQMLIDAEVALELALEGERMAPETASKQCPENSAHAIADRSTPSTQDAGAQCFNSMLGAAHPFQASHVLPGSVTPPCPHSTSTPRPASGPPSVVLGYHTRGGQQTQMGSAKNAADHSKSVFCEHPDTDALSVVPRPYNPHQTMCTRSRMH